MMRVQYSSNGHGLSNDEDRLEDEDQTEVGTYNLPSPTTMMRRLHTLSIDSKVAAVCSRTVPITPSWSITVWEWQSVSPVIETYWQVEQRGLQVSKQPQQHGGGGGAGGSRRGRADDTSKVGPPSSSSSTGPSASASASAMLDPFGLVMWPGSVVASLELLRHRHLVQDKVVFVIGAGVGVEAQAAAALGAKRVIATDVHPTTLRLLEHGVEQAAAAANADFDPDRVETRAWDLFGTDGIPDDVDLVVCADVLYNDNLACQLVKRISPLYQGSDDNDECTDVADEGLDTLGNETLLDDSQASHASSALSNGTAAPRVTKSTSGTNNGTGPSPSRASPVTLIVDSQRFCHGFEHDLNAELRRVGRRRTKVAWESRYLPSFTGSGILVEDDQTYDVKARVLWIQP